MNRPMFASVLSLAVLFVCGSGVSIGQDDKATEEKAPLFVRVKESDAGTPQALECAVVSYKIASGPYAGAVIDLIGAVHIGEQSYYQRLNSMFKSY
ncbi:MAG: hypothetical protein ACKO9Q_11420, partial [Pirellula sp.]